MEFDQVKRRIASKLTRARYFFPALPGADVTVPASPSPSAPPRAGLPRDLALPGNYKYINQITLFYSDLQARPESICAHFPPLFNISGSVFAACSTSPMQAAPSTRTAPTSGTPTSPTPCRPPPTSSTPSTNAILVSRHKLRREGHI